MGKKSDASDKKRKKDEKSSGLKSKPDGPDTALAGDKEKTDAAPDERGFLSRHWDVWLLFILLVVGLFFRLSVTLWEPMIFPDSTQYASLAREIRSGEFFSSSYRIEEGFHKSRRLPPLYPALLAPFASAGTDIDHVGIALSIAMSLAAMVILYLAGVMLYGKKSALAAAGVASFHTFTIWYAWPMLTEATFTALYMGVILASVYALKKPSLTAFVLCGVMGALCYMTRDVGVSAAFVAAGGAAFKLGFIDRIGWKKTTLFTAAVILAFLAAASPYLIHIRARTGSWGLTVQMEDTSVTEQMQLFGGDRFDRDRLKGKEKQTKLIGGREARGGLDLVFLAPGLMKKLVLNMINYGSELLYKWDPTVTGFMAVSIIATLAAFKRKKDYAELMLGLWTFVWILQLWALYALITPYMVDDRYMYPLMAPAILMAGHGAAAGAEWMIETLSGERPARPEFWRRVVPLLALAAVFSALMGGMTEPDSVKRFAMLTSRSPEYAYYFTMIGATSLFCLAAAGLARFFPDSWYRNERFYILAPALLAAGLILLVFPDVTSNFNESILARPVGGKKMEALVLGRVLFRKDLYKYAPALFCLGLFVTSILRWSLKGGKADPRTASASFIAVFVLSVFLAHLPDYMDLKDRMDPHSLANKYSAGHKEAANEMKSLGIVPPGKIICSRKTFMAYYLEGTWYMDHEKKEPIPKTMDEVKELVKSGKIDYLVADSFTLKSVRPAIVRLAYGLDRIPGARVVYSRFFPNYQRVITVYEVGSEESLAVPYGRSKRERLDAARSLMQKGYYHFALKEINAALAEDENDREALLLAGQIFASYYATLLGSRLPTMALDPEVLPTLVSVSQKYAEVAPDDPQSAEKAAHFRRMFEAEKNEIMEKARSRNGR